jgi:DNA polymerase I-like protein with 3'-5' exonuclease and polymerase domains
MKIFLTSKIDPFNLEKEACFYACQENINSAIVDIEHLLKYNEVTIISFEVPLLINYMKKNNLYWPRKIIDLNHIEKLLTGRPQKDFVKTRPWSIWRLVSSFYNNKDELALTKKVLSCFPTKLSKCEQHKLLLKLNNCIKAVYDNQIKRLKELNEYDRYFEVEKPINEILVERQYKGIKIDNNIFERRLDILDDIIYGTAKELRFKHNILSINDKNELVTTFKNQGLKCLAESINSDNYERFLKIGAKSNPLLRLLYDHIRAKRDKNALIKFGEIGCPYIYPIFDAMGTVTGRILVREPLIQQLRRTSRDIIIAEAYYSLIYADFSQFEPGILADDCGDDTLIDCYNSGDIYNALSTELFGEPTNRDLSKLIFLAYVYGMSQDRLDILIKELLNNEVSYNKGLEKFFGEFKKLKPYKTKLEKELLKNGRIGTRMGNFRYRRSSNSNGLLNEEKRWIVSQRVQGTASLILKRAILEISVDREIEFLLPMHDAALFQIPTSKLHSKKEFIESKFLKAFKEECPSIKPRVTFEKFDK